MSLPDRYLPNEVESRIYQWWNERGYFRATDVSSKPPFSIILPPPNVTGSLHLGHALDQSIQDVLIRWKRMSGYNVLWMPGTDHAGIATQSVVERELAKTKVFRKELGREKFVEKVWEWKHKYGDRIVEQMKRLGSSCDWDRHKFTLDKDVSKAVRKVFVELYKKNLIYKGTRLINWSPKLESAISDLEVEYKESKGSLWHFNYPLADGSGVITVATTRPETMLGDTAIAVHPEDVRYKAMVGKKVKHPVDGREISIIADDYVTRDFGSGAVKITPAHDFNDYEMGKRHNLPVINLLNKDATLNDFCGPFMGMKVADARKAVVAFLEEKGLLIKAEPITNSVGHCSRTDCVVEPMLSDQWFVKMTELAVPARHVVASETTQFIPEAWTKTYLHWMNIIQDWCISRQLWWGHRIPAWKCKSCSHFTVAEVDPTQCEKCSAKNLEQEEDVLDTWFSSALWPFSTLGWPEESEALKTFYPTSVLVTGHDIIFFWVARMMMMGLEFQRDVPFRKIYIHGLVRDGQGKKMSKSSNNTIDPVEIIDNFGADALRFTLMAQLASNRDLKFSQQRLEGYRNFMNKIWNAARFSLTVLADMPEVKKTGADLYHMKPDEKYLSDADRWITYKLHQCEKDVDLALKTYHFSEAANSVYNFAWHEFCDWYLEFIKPVVYNKDPDEKSIQEKNATMVVLAQTLNRIMRLLHPFVPFITEEIYQKLPIRKEALIVDSYPNPSNDKEWLNIGSEEKALELDVVKEVITAIRNVRGENRIKPGIAIDVRLAGKSAMAEKILEANRPAIMKMSNLKSCEIASKGTVAKSAVAPVKVSDIEVDVVIPLEGLVDFAEEVARLNKAIEKSQKELDGLERRMGDHNFVKNAPEDVVELGQQQLGDLKAKIKVLNEGLRRLS